MLIRDLMVDCETVSARPNAALLSIAAVKFAPIPGGELVMPTFYRIVGDLNSQESDYGRHIDPDTLLWWGKQSPEAQKEVFDNPHAVRLELALAALRDFVHSDPNVLVNRIWSFGATADIVWLNEACRAVKVPFPFHYRDHMCLRTLATLTGVSRPQFVNGETKHHALYDVLNQAKWAQLCLAKLHATAPELFDTVMDIPA